MDPYSAVMFGLSIFKGFGAKKAAKKRARAIMRTARYNAKIARENAEAESKAIARSAVQLMESQRQQKASERLNVAARGGTLMGGSDLVTITNNARLMQDNVLEVGRQAGLAKAYGQNVAAKIMIEAEAAAYGAKIEGQSAMLNSLIQGASYVNWNKVGDSITNYFDKSSSPTQDPSFLNSIGPAPGMEYQVAGYGEPLNFDYMYNPTARYREGI